MNSSNESSGKSRIWGRIVKYAPILSFVLSLVALLVSFSVAYHTALKPFGLETRIDPRVQIQHKHNFGLYLDVDFFNKSPTKGSITQLAVILYNTTTPEDKYLLTFYDFRMKVDSTRAPDIYTHSGEDLPIFFAPWQRQSKIINFIYTNTNEEFPISTGTYTCELLVWVNDNANATYSKTLKLNISADILKLYQNSRSKNSTELGEIYIVGYTPLIAKKLTDSEYMQLK